VLGLLFVLVIGCYLVTTDAVPLYPETGSVPDAKEIVECLQPHLKEGDWVLTMRYVPFRYYAYRLGMPMEVFGKEGDGDAFVVVRLPRDTFARVAKDYDLQLDEGDFFVEEFPFALLYVPRSRADEWTPCR
jgi:hypothetical protein